MPSTSRLQVGPYTVDLHRRTATNGEGTALPLRWRHFEALKTLVEANQEVVTKESVLRAALARSGARRRIEPHAVHFSAAKSARRTDTATRPYIETVPRIGYRLVAPIQSIPDTEASGDAKDRGPARRTRVSQSFQAGPAESPSATSARWNRVALAAAAVVLVVSGVAIGWRLQPCAALRDRFRHQPRRGSAARICFGAATRRLPSGIAARGSARSDGRDAYATLAHALNRLAPVNSVARPPGHPHRSRPPHAPWLDPSVRWMPRHAWVLPLLPRLAMAPRRDTPARSHPPGAVQCQYPSVVCAAAGCDRPAAEALEQIEFALARQPYDVGWHAIRASILYSARRYPEAVEAADKGLAVKDTERGPWEWKSKALFQMGRGADAIKALAQQAFAPHSTALDRAVQESGP